MTQGPDPTELDLSDAELMQLLKSHDLGRRTLLKVLGLGGAATLATGTAAAGHDPPHPPHIDSQFGYVAPADERLPGKLRPDHTVELHIDDPPLGFHFDPMGIQVEVGDIVRFDFESPDHTVTAYHTGHGRQQRVPDAAPPYSSPMINPGGFWLYRFDHPGTHDIYCGPHQFFAMVMRIVVGDPDSPAYDGEFGSTGRPPLSRGMIEGIPGVTSWPFTLPAEVFETDAMSVRNIVENGPVSRFDVAAEL